MSVSTTSTLLSDLSASSDASSKPSPPRRRLEISTGDGLFYLFVCGVKGVGKTSLVTRVSSPLYMLSNGRPSDRDRLNDDKAECLCMF